ncbi:MULTISPECIES: cupin domain-containing protein [Acidocella]|uniref:cupin domain-containing protein n=1 Tax=Acidocella TaxID=50709 RepID=UPI00028C191A|nr:MULTISPECIES: cupin domain-containing protein [Acidocella]EKN01048.1 XRE family transcriptional regulator [Acidocella sp. MX-AZ02]WBO60635.1 cupin domain-containing protein [Acidocella sp. MX-AZ03]
MSVPLPAETSTDDIGTRLKLVRQIFGLTQRELARRAGVTNGAISLIEQNRVSPSISSLKKILDGIPLTLADFFTLDFSPSDEVFFTAAELTEIAYQPEMSMRLVGRKAKGRALGMLRETYQPGADTGDTMLRHEGEECGIIVSGSLTVTVGVQERVLNPGDAYYFRSDIPHRFRNQGEEPCVLISANSPPTF